MWYYKTQIGTFQIRPGESGVFDLWIHDDKLGSYLSPVAAADDVYMQVTTCNEWDALPSIDQPTDLSEWTKVP